MGVQSGGKEQNLENAATVRKEGSRAPRQGIETVMENQRLQTPEARGLGQGMQVNGAGPALVQAGTTAGECVNSIDGWSLLPQSFEYCG